MKKDMKRLSLSVIVIVRELVGLRGKCQWPLYTRSEDPIKQGLVSGSMTTSQ